MRNIFPFLFVVCLVPGTQILADNGTVHHQIRQWIQQLGNESFLVRQRAETLLIRTGIQAYPELQQAKRNNDVEIVRRAEYILSQIEQAFRGMENQDVASWIQRYMNETHPAAKARIIWFIADPVPTLLKENGFDKGEGLQTLCRLLRFEENKALRLEAAKCLIASPPTSPALRQKWYQHIRDNIHDTGDDEVFQCLARYATLWCELDDADEKITLKFQDQVRQVSTDTSQLLDNPKDSIQIGNKIDILLHYAIAELQDAAGLTEDRDKTVLKALAIQPEPIQTSESIEPDPGDGWLMYEHYRVGWYLEQKFRLHWATAHFQKVMDTGYISLRVLASQKAAEIAILLADYPSAIAFFDKHIEIVESPDYRETDAPLKIAQTQQRKAYCLAMKAAAEEDWNGVQVAIIQGWQHTANPDDILDIDLLILAHQLCQEQFDIDPGFRDKVDSHLKKLWQHIENDHLHSTYGLCHINMCNSAAWLLANTGGDYKSALTLVEAALKIEPDNINVMDTLAHVYFIGGKIEEAICAQEKVVRFAPEVVVFRQALERFKRAQK